MNIRTRSLLVAAVIASAAACRSESPSALEPQAPVGSVDFAKKVKNASTLDTSTVLTRLTPFTSDVTVSAVIGSGGGTLELKDAGLTMIVPAGAVSSNQTFSITAVAGDMIAYEFAPHMVFAKPVRLEQKLSFFTVPSDLNSVTIGYFATRADLGLTDADVGTIQEQLPVTFDLTGGKARADVVHFSGYLMASNRSGVAQ